MATKWIVDIRVDPDYRRRLKLRYLRQVVKTALAAEGVEAEKKLSLILTDDDTVRKLNHKYRSLNETTDVLSFSFQEDGRFISPPGAKAHLGEIVVSYPQAESQALEAGHTVEKEVTMLIVHGVLHILGYDHELPEQASIMQDRERTILAQITSPLLAEAQP